MSSEQEAILRFGIEIEKMLCEKLGKQWRPSGMSIESLVEEMSAKANAPSAFVHLPKDPDRFIALHPGDRLTIEARNPAPAVDAEQDANRYRWLKENSARISWNPARFNKHIVDGFAAFGTGYLGYSFEQAIDLAMQAGDSDN